jgi:hypothetical protein
MLKKIRMAGLLAAFALAAVTAAPAAAGTTVLTFDKKKDAKQFDPIVGDWTVKNGIYGVKFKKEEPAFTLYKKDVGDVKATVIFRLSTIFQSAGALVRTELTKDKKSAQGYFISYLHGGDLAAGAISVISFDGMAGESLCQAQVNVPAPTDWQELVIELKGSNFAISFNGKQVCKFKDSKYKKGFFGLQSTGFKGSIFDIDEVILEQ